MFSYGNVLFKKGKVRF